ncbi:hypothetical protein [Pleurocapsa sp. CCALA 161]|nr:hypothetical protein [Pleurocapsa sp. CCALA 161]
MDSHKKAMLSIYPQRDKDKSSTGQGQVPLSSVLAKRSPIKEQKLPFYLT